MPELLTFDRRFVNAESLKRDAWGGVLSATDAETGRPAIVRRLDEKHRRDPMAIAALRAEVDYAKELDDEHAPHPALIKLGGPEYVLHYKDLEGARLDVLLEAVELAGFGFTPAGAIALVQDVLLAAVAIQQTRPPAARDRSTWGHGEITPSNVVVSSRGVARLINATFCVSSVAAAEEPSITRISRAPELGADDKHGTRTGDVFGIGALLAMAVLGPRTLLGGGATLRGAAMAGFRRMGGAVDPRFTELVLSALAMDPSERPESPASLRGALRECASADDLIGGVAAIAEAVLDRTRVKTISEAADRYPGVLMQPGHSLSGRDQATRSDLSLSSQAAAISDSTMVGALDPPLSAATQELAVPEAGATALFTLPIPKEAYRPPADQVSSDFADAAEAPTLLGDAPISPRAPSNGAQLAEEFAKAVKDTWTPSEHSAPGMEFDDKSPLAFNRMPLAASFRPDERSARDPDLAGATPSSRSLRERLPHEVRERTYDSDLPEVSADDVMEAGANDNADATQAGIIMTPDFEEAVAKAREATAPMAAPAPAPAPAPALAPAPVVAAPGEWDSSGFTPVPETVGQRTPMPSVLPPLAQRAPTSQTPFPHSAMPPPGPATHTPYPAAAIPAPAAHTPYPQGAMPLAGGMPRPATHTPYPMPATHTPYPQGGMPRPATHTPYPVGAGPATHTPYPQGGMPRPSTHTPFPAGMMPPPQQPMPLRPSAQTPFPAGMMPPPQQPMPLRPSTQAPMPPPSHSSVASMLGGGPQAATFAPPMPASPPPAAPPPPRTFQLSASRTGSVAPPVPEPGPTPIPRSTTVEDEPPEAAYPVPSPKLDRAKLMKRIGAGAGIAATLVLAGALIYNFTETPTGSALGPGATKIVAKDVAPEKPAGAQAAAPNDTASAGNAPVSAAAAPEPPSEPAPKLAAAAPTPAAAAPVIIRDPTPPPEPAAKLERPGFFEDRKSSLPEPKRDRRDPSYMEPEPEPVYTESDTVQPQETLTAAAAALPNVPAQLVVNVIPWGRVFVDGEDRGYPPVLVDGISPGAHSVRIIRRGFRTVERKVEIQPGVRKMIHIRFDSKTDQVAPPSSSG